MQKDGLKLLSPVMQKDGLKLLSPGMTVVAEGVETEDDIAYATELGCDELQGYGVARPMTADALARWLEAQA